MEKLVQHVAKAVHAQQLWQPGDTIVVACSGGPDSLALADILLQLRETDKLRIVLAHFEHGIRGAASLADAEFVKEYALQHGVEFFCRSENIPARARELGLSLETAARQCRYGFLYQLAREQGNALLATAHHADDQAETVLMRILRGTGITGLAAMRPRQGRLIRPLLGVRRSELEAYCLARGLQPRQDETNFIPVYLRNRLRLELFPQLQQAYNPQVVEALNQLAEVAAEADAHLTEEAEAWLSDQAEMSAKKVSFDRKAFAVLSAALQAAVLRCALAKFSLRDNVSFGELRKMRNLICQGDTGAELTLPKGWQLVLCYEQATLCQRTLKVKEQQQRSLQVPGITRIPELGLTVTAELFDTMPEGLSQYKIVVDAELLPAPYRLRTRQAGDSFALKEGRKKLKEYFIDLKIPREEREKIPVFTAGEEIFWLGGLRQPYVAWVSRQTKQYLCFTLEADNEKQEEKKC